MIKRQVLHRAEIKTVYSSERQQRMKVYFQLTDEFNQCIEPCKLQPNEEKQECSRKCETIYDRYAQLLKPRYEQNKQRLDMEVKYSPIIRSRRRPDRDGWFYDIFGVSFKQALGIAEPLKVQTEPRLIG